MMKQKFGFTLAEVLIVIGIIGVVAALTLPNLNHATGDKETVTRLQKAYSILNEATDRAQAIYGPIAEWDCSAYAYNGGDIQFDVCFMNRIKEYLKIAKSCNVFGDEEDGTYSSCDFLEENGNLPSNGIMFQFPDGITIGTRGYTCDDDGRITTYDGATYNLCSDITIDVNGPTKGKNQEGQDIFFFGIEKNRGIVTKNDDTSCETVECRIEDCYFAKKADCSFWVLEYGNLDYLKADENGVCPNGVQLSWTVTSCN